MLKTVDLNTIHSMFFMEYYDNSWNFFLQHLLYEGRNLSTLLVLVLVGEFRSYFLASH